MRIVAGLWGEERGYSLPEMLIVMVILGIVMAGLTTVFVGASNAEIELSRRFQSQQQARLALDSLRADLHCGSKAQVYPSNTPPLLKVDISSCTAATTVSWCVVTAATNRYQLWRTTSTSNICLANDPVRKLVADYLTSASVFTTPTIAQWTLQTVGVDIRVNPEPTKTSRTYRLNDAIVLRNYLRCGNTGNLASGTPATCALPSVP